MDQAFFSYEISKKLKQDAEVFFKCFDLTTTDGIKIFFAMVDQTGNMPFSSNYTKKDIPRGKNYCSIVMRVDSERLTSVKQILKNNGYSVSFACRLFLTECVKRREFPFVLRQTESK